MRILKKYRLLVMNSPPIDWPALWGSIDNIIPETTEYIKKTSTEIVVDGTNKIIIN